MARQMRGEERRLGVVAAERVREDDEREGRPSLASGTSRPLASGAVGYQTASAGSGPAHPGKVPFAMVGRDPSTNTNDVSPTPYGPGSSKRVPARVSRTSVTGATRVWFARHAPAAASDAVGGARAGVVVGSSSAFPSSATWSVPAAKTQSSTRSGFGPQVKARS